MLVRILTNYPYFRVIILEITSRFCCLIKTIKTNPNDLVPPCIGGFYGNSGLGYHI